MNKTEFCEKVAAKLRDDDARKPTPSERHTFRISDEDGHSSKFVVKKSGRMVSYNIDDVKIILNACIDITEEALKQGDKVAIQGFGTLGLRYHGGRTIQHPGTGEKIEIPGHYVPKFTYGDHLRTCARLYEQSDEANAEGEDVDDGLDEQYDLYDEYEDETDGD